MREKYYDPHKKYGSNWRMSMMSIHAHSLRRSNLEVLEGGRIELDMYTREELEDRKKCGGGQCPFPKCGRPFLCIR